MSLFFVWQDAYDYMVVEEVEEVVSFHFECRVLGDEDVKFLGAGSSLRRVEIAFAAAVCSLVPVDVVINVFCSVPAFHVSENALYLVESD